MFDKLPPRYDPPVMRRTDLDNNIVSVAFKGSSAESPIVITDDKVVVRDGLFVGKFWQRECYRVVSAARASDFRMRLKVVWRFAKLVLFSKTAREL